MKKTNGYTLVEVSISMAILSVVSLLGFIVLNTSTQTASMTNAKATTQANLRDCMGALTAELRQAYTERVADSAAAPDDVEPISVGAGGTSITFQVPEPSGDSPLPVASSPITISWVNEDLNLEGEDGFAVLDDGEDTDDDGVLTRRLIRTQDGVSRVLGGSNDLSNVQFTLLASLDDDDDRLTSVQIRLESAKRFGPKVTWRGEQNGQALVQSELVSSIHLEN